MLRTVLTVGLASLLAAVALPMASAGVNLGEKIEDVRENVCSLFAYDVCSPPICLQQSSPLGVVCAPTCAVRRVVEAVRDSVAPQQYCPILPPISGDDLGAA
ncbi:MAG TPA: hypothetical protein VM681_06630 [Candidatus Thermoplasmatota archaeon]|nr:hypothetical protein [Candidatus Thermoplasmatota archaeon]